MGEGKRELYFLNYLLRNLGPVQSTARSKALTLGSIPHAPRVCAESCGVTEGLAGLLKVHNSFLFRTCGFLLFNRVLREEEFESRPNY